MIFIDRYREENGRIIGPPQWWFDDAERQTALAIVDVDPPEQYLGFDPQGQIYALDDDPFGEDTIRLCHLKRRRLRLRRQRVMREVVDLLEVARLAEDTGNMRVARRIRRCIRTNYAHDSAPHAAVARAVVGDPDAFGVG